MTLTIRTGLDADIDRVHALNLEVFPEHWSQQGLRDVLHQGYELLIAEDEGHFAGYLLSQDILDETHILQVAVQPATQRRGIARALSRRLLERKAAAGQRRLLLEVRASNHAAQQLYDSLGFQQVGRRKAYYTPPAGSSEREDALLMDLTLPA